MKKVLLSLLLLTAVIFSVEAQVPQRLNYQAVVRDANGIPVANNTPVRLRFTIHDGTSGGPSVYQESHNSLFANQFGLVTAQIGAFGNLDTVNWGSGPKFLQVEVDVNNSGTFT